ncbi:MAG: PIN domain-containing protein [Thermoleophilia bacterium]|nr:PIN domain-containing protein [Thermoleophilia bacterium]
MIFVDTSYWIALALERDRHHLEAARLAPRPARSRLGTSSLVRGETWTYLRRRTSHAFAMSWLDGMAKVETHQIDQALEADAWAWLRVHDERPYSFVDATSFALMRSLRITDALAFDGDFEAAGFVELRL